MSILNKTLELSNDKRMEYWLELAEELGDRDDFEYAIENVNDIYLENGVKEKKLFGFYVDSDLEEFFMACNINADYKDDDTCILTLEGEKYQAKTVDLVNRHGDDLVDETVLQLHTLIHI